jgi:hypothetical protein
VTHKPHDLKVQVLIEWIRLTVRSWGEQLLYLKTARTDGVERMSKLYGEQVRADFVETLRAEGKVDRFQVPVASGSGKPKTVYRATTKLVESD